MRIAFAILMALHGLAHAPGFLNSWRLKEFPDVPYTTTLFRGGLEIGEGGRKSVGLLWLLTALGFLVAAYGAFTAADWWWGVALGTSVVSLILSAAELPAARIGLPINAVILVGLLLFKVIGPEAM